MSRYFFFDNWDIPAKYEQTVPQVFPTTAPGNFTWLPDAGHFVMTSFYPYQWDLNYRNPRVFNEMMYNFLFLANKLSLIHILLTLVHEEDRPVPFLQSDELLSNTEPFQPWIHFAPKSGWMNDCLLYTSHLSAGVLTATGRLPMRRKS